MNRTRRVDSNVKFSKKYRHIGISYPGVPEGWIPIVKDAVIRIERIMWPRWIPFPIRQLIHFLAMGNSIVRIKYWWAYRLRQHVTQGQIITCIKEKFAGLRIYGCYNEDIERIIVEAEIACNNTCQTCGGSGPRIVNRGWIYNLCSKCETEQFNL
jgi:hypothetical protein